MRAPIVSSTATTVAAATRVVKPETDDGRLRGGHDAGSVEQKDFWGRLAHVVNLAKSKRQAAAVLGLSHASLANVIRLKRKVDFDTLVLLHQKTGVNLNWLLTGVGSTGDIKWPETDTEQAQRRTRRRITVDHRESGKHTLPSKKQG